jgi:hypothetical protein
MERVVDYLGRLAPGRADHDAVAFYEGSFKGDRRRRC